MASISGQSTSNIDNVDGFFTTQGGGGTATTTPTITALADTYGLGSLVVGNFASYTNVTFQCEVYVGATLIVANSLTTADGATIGWADTSALSGTRTVKLRAQEFGNFIESAEATDTYEKLATSFRYFRIQGVDVNGAASSLHMGVRDWRYYSAQSFGGTEYPTDMTTDSLPIPFVASGYYFSSYSPKRAFDSSTNTWWWTLSVSSAALNHLTIDMGSQTTMLSARIMFYSGQSLAYFSIMASNTGAFAGEEVYLNTAIACNMKNQYQSIM
tara:strand:+ start:2684 stop:3496 length:813 start_codon:yes stop_codon:yes gene_type:complete